METLTHGSHVRNMEYGKQRDKTMNNHIEETITAKVKNQNDILRDRSLLILKNKIKNYTTMQHIIVCYVYLPKCYIDITDQRMV